MVLLASRSRVTTKILLVACVAALALGVFLQNSGPLAKPSKTVQPQITNRTKSIRISQVRKLDNGDVEVTLFNQSSKYIFAYTVVTGQRGVRKGFTTFADTIPLAPGETKAETIAARNLDSFEADSTVRAEIVFSAVYLEGGTTEGDSPDAEKLRVTMQGMKDQAKLAVDLLRTAVASRELNPKRLLETLESDAVALSVQDDAAASSRDRSRGKALVHDRLLKAVKRIRGEDANDLVALRGVLADLIPYYQRLAEKL
jgi:hypothetical protein